MKVPRGRPGTEVSAHDLLVSVWTLPENIRYQIIRTRYDQAIDVPYVHETARLLVAMLEAGRTDWYWRVRTSRRRNTKNA